MSTTGIAYTSASHLHHVDVEISSGYSICLAPRSHQSADLGSLLLLPHYLGRLPDYLEESLAKTSKNGIHSFPAWLSLLQPLGLSHHAG